MQQQPAAYIVKQANFVSSVALGLSKAIGTANKAFTGIQGATAGLTKYKSAIKWGTPAATAAIGAGVGAAKAEEGSKGRGALMGALGGGIVGTGVGMGINKLPTLGKTLMGDFAPAGKRLAEIASVNPNIGFKEIMDRGSKYMGKNFAEQWSPVANKGNIKDLLDKGQIKNLKQLKTPPEITTGIGTKGKVTAVDLSGREHSVTSRAFAHMGGSWTAGREGFMAGGASGAVKGLGTHLWQDVKNMQSFISTKGGVTHQVERSALGKIVNPVLMSGVGMGAMDAATATNSDGSKASIGKKIRKGTTSALGWGLAPPVMAGKLVYDTSKSIIGGHKPQQNINNQGAV